MHCKRGKVRALDDNGHVARIKGAVVRGRQVALEVGDAELTLRREADEPSLLGWIARVTCRLSSRAEGRHGIGTRRAHDCDCLAAVVFEEVHGRVAVDVELA